MDSIRTGGLTLDGNVPSVFLGLLPGMGADRGMTSRVRLLSPKASGRDTGMRVPCFRAIDVEHLGLLRGHVQLLNKEPFHPCY